MINQLRTYLLNRDAATLSAAAPGAEYVDPSYRSLKRPGSLTPLETLLFGVDTDAAFLHYRARQYLSILHAAGMDHSLDPRVSYQPEVTGDDNQFFQLYSQGAVVTQTAGAVDSVLQVTSSGQIQAENRLRRVWTLEVAGLTTVDVVTYGESATPTAVTLTFVDEGGSGVITLPDSNWLARFTPEVGAAWTVTALAVPRLTLSGILERLPSCLTPSVRAVLFADDPNLETMADSHHLPFYRLAAVLRALADLTARRKGSPGGA